MFWNILVWKLFQNWKQIDNGFIGQFKVQIHGQHHNFLTAMYCKTITFNYRKILFFFVFTDVIALTMKPIKSKYTSVVVASIVFIKRVSHAVKILHHCDEIVLGQSCT